MGSSGCSFPFPTGRAWSPGTVGISIRVPHPLLRALPAARGGSGPWSLLDPANSCSWESRSHPGHAPGQGSTRSLSWWRAQQQSWRAVSELGTARGCSDAPPNPSPSPSPAPGLSRVTVSVRMLARPSMAGIAFPGTEPGWGQQPGSEDGVGTLGCQAGLAAGEGRAVASGQRSECSQQRLAAAGVCRSPDLSRAKFGTHWPWHKALALAPPWYLCDRALVLPPHRCFQGEGPSITLCPICPLPVLGSPSSPGVSLHPWEDAAASPGCLWPPPRRGLAWSSSSGVLEGEGLGRSISHPAHQGKDETRPCSD